MYIYIEEIIIHGSFKSTLINASVAIWAQVRWVPAGLLIQCQAMPLSADAERAKRRRLECLATTTITTRCLARVLAKLTDSDSCHAATISRDASKYLKIHTPLGKLIEIVELPLEGGKIHKWAFANPAALLYCLCQRSGRFAEMLEGCCLHGPAGVVLYSDETTPGNQYRPDAARESLCCYWSIIELPQWFRDRLHR